MALYRWRIPILKALQYDGKNKKEVKALIGDTSESEDPTIATGKYEEPPQEAKHLKKGEEPEPAPAPAGPPKEIREKLKVKEGDWVTVDTMNAKIEVNPEGFPEKYEYVP